MRTRTLKKKKEDTGKKERGFTQEKRKHWEERNKESTKKKSNFRYVFLLFLNFMCSWHNIIKIHKLHQNASLWTRQKPSCIHSLYSHRPASPQLAATLTFLSLVTLSTQPPTFFFLASLPSNAILSLTSPSS